MEPISSSSDLAIFNPWILAFILIFVILIIYFLVKFFSVLFEFIQAKGCLTVGLLALVGLPGIIVLSLVTGYTITAAVLILFAIIGVITGYIARDSEGSVGTFGNFIMIVSIITLVIALILSKMLHLF
jgi:hypothetical protein